MADCISCHRSKMDNEPLCGDCKLLEEEVAGEVYSRWIRYRNEGNSTNLRRL